MPDQSPISDTCQIVALLGRELLGWGKVPPDISQFPIFYRPEGDGYVEQCPWAAMGIEALPPGQPDMDHMQFFTAPRYADDGLAAELSFITKLVARDAKGRPLSPYINQVDLTVSKIDGHWALIEQKQGPVT
jgi:hypothetical protein